MQPATVAGARSQQASQGGTSQQQDLTPLRNDGPGFQHVEVLPLDGMQNGKAATAEELDVKRQPTIDLLGQRQAAMEPLAGTLHFELHHREKLLGGPLVGQVLLGNAEAGEIFERKIDAAFLEVDGNILPEIGELQCGASEVGKLLAFRIVVAAQVEHKMTHGVGRVLAVAEQVGEAWIAGDNLVLAKGLKKIRKLMPRDTELLHGFAQRYEYWMTRLPVVTARQFGLPLVEQQERLLLVADFIAEVVGDATVSVDVIEMLVQVLGKKPSDDRKIFVVRGGEFPAIFLGLGESRRHVRDSIFGRKCAPAGRL